MISNVEIRAQAHAIEIEIAVSASFVPQAVRLTGPDRLVFDFPGYQLNGANRIIPINSGPVRQLRLSQFSVLPLVTRVVVDSKEALDFQVKSAGNNVVIEIAFSGAATNSAASVRPSSPPNTAAKGHATPSVKATYQPIPNIATQPSTSPTSTSRITAIGLQAKAKTLSLENLQSLEDKAQSGDPEAQTTLALAYHDAVLLKKDDAESLRLLHKAAARHYVAAEEALGIYAQNGIGKAQPAPAEAMEWFRKAALQGSFAAETNIALMYADGVGVTKDPAQAIAWFRLAADGGEGAAQYNLALMYARGEGTPQDSKEALRWLTAAADQSVVPAVMDLGAFYLHPSDGTTPDVEHAIRCYEKAAELGSDRAPAVLGNIFANGTEGKPDYEQSVKWYQKAAAEGQRDGEYGLGVRYAYGQGVPVDLQQARRLFEAAAAQGLAPAQYNVAMMCEEGSGAQKDQSCAAKYYQLAADQGMAKAQYRLGRLLAGSRESGSDRVSAYKWLMLAQASIQESSPVLNDLKKSMSEQEISEAERLVDSWRTAHP